MKSQTLVIVESPTKVAAHIPSAWREVNAAPIPPLPAKNSRVIIMGGTKTIT